jgi:CDP-diacylglycerol---glycerol-3-phosphate 3-phosphatidyltransferase
MKHVPNLITFCRIIFVPLTWYFFMQDHFDWEHQVFLGQSAPFWVMWLIILSGASDFADGQIARKIHVQSNFGKIMDPVADKLFITTCWIFLMVLGRIHPVWIIIALGRDAFIGALRNFAGSEGKIIAASGTGKLKTIIQFVSIGFLTHAGTLGFIPWLPVFLVGQILFFIALFLSYYSLFDYLYAFLKKRPRSTIQ